MRNKNYLYLANSPSFSILQESYIPVLSNSFCQAWFDKRNIQILDVLLCAGFVSLIEI